MLRKLIRWWKWKITNTSQGNRIISEQSKLVVRSMWQELNKMLLKIAQSRKKMRKKQLRMILSLNRRRSSKIWGSSNSKIQIQILIGKKKDLNLRKFQKATELSTWFPQLPKRVKYLRSILAKVESLALVEALVNLVTFHPTQKVGSAASDKAYNQWVLAVAIRAEIGKIPKEARSANSAKNAHQYYKIVK